MYFFGVDVPIVGLMLGAFIISVLLVIIFIFQAIRSALLSRDIKALGSSLEKLRREEYMQVHLLAELASGKNHFHHVKRMLNNIASAFANDQAKADALVKIQHKQVAYHKHAAKKHETILARFFHRKEYHEAIKHKIKTHVLAHETAKLNHERAVIKREKGLILMLRNLVFRKDQALDQMKHGAKKRVYSLRKESPHGFFLKLSSVIFGSFSVACFYVCRKLRLVSRFHHLLIALELRHLDHEKEALQRDSDVLSRRKRKIARKERLISLKSHANKGFFALIVAWFLKHSLYVHRMNLLYSEERLDQWQKHVLNHQKILHSKIRSFAKEQKDELAAVLALLKKRDRLLDKRESENRSRRTSSLRALRKHVISVKRKLLLREKRLMHGQQLLVSHKITELDEDLERLQKKEARQESEEQSIKRGLSALSYWGLPKQGGEVLLKEFKDSFHGVKRQLKGDESTLKRKIKNSHKGYNLDTFQHWFHDEIESLSNLEKSVVRKERHFLKHQERFLLQKKDELLNYFHKALGKTSVKKREMIDDRKLLAYFTRAPESIDDEAIRRKVPKPVDLRMFLKKQRPVVLEEEYVAASVTDKDKIHERVGNFLIHESVKVRELFGDAFGVYRKVSSKHSKKADSWAKFVIWFKREFSSHPTGNPKHVYNASIASAATTTEERFKLFVHGLYELLAYESADSMHKAKSRVYSLPLGMFERMRHKHRLHSELGNYFTHMFTILKAEEHSMLKQIGRKGKKVVAPEKEFLTHVYERMKLKEKEIAGVTLRKSVIHQHARRNEAKT